MISGPHGLGLKGEGEMTKAAQYRLNAANCAEMAGTAENEPNRNRFKRMESAWRALAEEQDWLDGERSPLDPNMGPKAKK